MIRSRTQFKIQKKKKFELPDLKKYILVLSIVLSIGGIVFTTIETAAEGAEVTKLEREEASLVEENRELSEKSLGTSLSQTEESAQNTGFIKPQKIVYLGEEETVASSIK
ncbi:hypothetical protein HY045_00400 [Candidatus Woesebacteria bacterium]|nr:hypothetical protein [Candidatus Woesebacteria bacterium]